MREIIRRILREESQKTDLIKNMVFRYWDENGPSLNSGKYFSLSEDETLKYLVEYHGDNIEELITNEVKERIENYHNCSVGGDVDFNLRFDSIVFKKKPEPERFNYPVNFFYSVTFEIDKNSEVFSGFNSEDRESIMAEIEVCVNFMLNDIIHETYGVLVHGVELIGMYNSNT